MIGRFVGLPGVFQAMFWFLFSYLPGLPRPACDWFKFVTKFTQLQVRNPRSYIRRELLDKTQLLPRAVEYLHCPWSGTNLWVLLSVPSRKSQAWNLNPRNLVSASTKTHCARLPPRRQESHELARGVPVVHKSSKAVFTTWTTVMRGWERWCRISLHEEEWARSRFCNM